MFSDEEQTKVQLDVEKEDVSSAKKNSEEVTDDTHEEKTEKTEIQTTRISEEATDGTPEKKVEESTEKKTNSSTTTQAAETTVKSGKIGKFKITGYTAEEGFSYGATTASGVGCKPGICAMNNTRRKELGLSYGDQIYIEGLGTFTVADCGCNYNVVDVWVYTNSEAANLTGYRDVYYS